MNTLIARRAARSNLYRPTFSQRKPLLSVPVRTLKDENMYRKQDTDDKWKNFKEASKDVVNEASQRTSEMAGAVASKAKDAVQNTASSLKQTVKDAAQSTLPGGDSVQNLAQKAKESAQDATQMVKNVTSSLPEDARRTATESNLSQATNDAENKAQSTASSTTGEVLSNIKDGIVKTAEFAVEKTKQLKDKAMDMMSNSSKEDVANVASEKGQEFKNRAEEMAQQVKDRASEAATNVKNRASENIEKAKNKI